MSWRHRALDRSGRVFRRGVQRCLEGLAKRSPAVEALLEFHDDPSLDPWGGPFNGQRARQLMVSELLRQFPARALVETGTYRGSTTEFLASETDLPVISIESNRSYYLYARLRLREYDNVRLIEGYSPTVLQRLAHDKHFPTQHIIFYLDAHWGEELPLVDELCLVAQGWQRSVIIIDDFKVPDDPGYGYDDYGEGARLTAEILPDALNGWRRWYPNTSSEEETGARRGCIVLSDLNLDAIGMLRR